MMKHLILTTLILSKMVLSSEVHKYEHSTDRLKVAIYSNAELIQLYNEYIETHGHTRTPKENCARMQLFRQEIKEILKLRANSKIKWRAGINIMADMTAEEKEIFSGYNKNSSATHDNDIFLETEFRKADKTLSMPAEFDEWRASHMIGPIRTQLKGTCWANSAVVPIEAQLAQLSDLYRELSVQELYDCTYPADHKITSGTVTHAWRYVEKSNRLGLRQEFPETLFPKRYDCSRYNGKTNGMKGYSLRGWHRVSNEKDLIHRLVATSPITVSIDAKKSNLWRYMGGTFNALNCRPDPDHGMVVVGYTTQTFIIRNSWGSRWGENGYVQWDRQGPKCCLLDDAFYPYIEKEN